MSDLTPIEKRALERFLDMSGGYVLNFSNLTFQEFVLDSTGYDVYDNKYNYGSGSKANQLRGFWKTELNSYRRQTNWRIRSIMRLRRGLAEPLTW